MRRLAQLQSLANRLRRLIEEINEIFRNSLARHSIALDFWRRDFRPFFHPDLEVPSIHSDVEVPNERDDLYGFGFTLYNQLVGRRERNDSEHDCPISCSDAKKAEDYAFGYHPVCFERTNKGCFKKIEKWSTFHIKDRPVNVMLK